MLWQNRIAGIRQNASANCDKADAGHPFYPVPDIVKALRNASGRHENAYDGIPYQRGEKDQEDRQHHRPQRQHIGDSRCE